MVELSCVIFLAFFLDLFFGDPGYRLHPIRMIGHGIAFFEKILRRIGLDRKVGGILLVLLIETASLTAYLAFSLGLYRIYRPLGLGFDLFICYSCLALKDLISHITPVIDALENGNLSVARQKIAMVVGRNVRYLDQNGVSRAAVETLGENFVDGFLSPFLWYMAGGILGHFLGFSPIKTALSIMLGFKVISTLDSMVGYKNPHFFEFGWAGARLDDLMNFIPARLSLVILFAGAWASGLHPLEGLRTALRDRLKHDSPNAAHAEAFVAGTLRIRLGGPTRYTDGLRGKPWLGLSDVDPGPEHITKTILLLKHSAWITIVIPLCILLLSKATPL